MTLFPVFLRLLRPPTRHGSRTPRAVYLTPDKFPVHPDGSADDSEAIQQAINKVEETHHQGILFIPEGRYRINKTIYVWPGIRFDWIRSQASSILRHSEFFCLSKMARPTWFSSQGDGLRLFVLVVKTDEKSTDARKATPPDANPGTFYSAMSNIDIEIQDGNPGAVGVPRALCSTLLFVPHGFPHRFRFGRNSRWWQCRSRRPFLRRPVTASGLENLPPAGSSQ